MKVDIANWLTLKAASLIWITTLPATAVHCSWMWFHSGDPCIYLDRLWLVLGTLRTCQSCQTKHEKHRGGTRAKSARNCQICNARHWMYSIKFSENKLYAGVWKTTISFCFNLHLFIIWLWIVIGVTEGNLQA